MNIMIEPAKLTGSIAAIPSKSYAHRILTACALADRPTNVLMRIVSDDVRSAIQSLGMLGADIKTLSKEINISPLKSKSIKRPIINCGESGTMARFLLPVAAALYDEGVISGEGSLANRPFETLCNTLEDNGCKFENVNLPIIFRGKINPGNYKIRGDESSQFISGLLFALPLLNGDSKITLTTKLESSGYVDMTLHVLRMFNIKIGYDAHKNGLSYDTKTFKIKGCQVYESPGTVAVEGDWSNAAFWLAAGLKVTNLNQESLQKDKLFSAMSDQSEIDASETPDLVPILSVVAAARNGTSVIFNVKRLRLKESDRIQSTANMLLSLGANVRTYDNKIVISGSGRLKGGIVDGANDHRIVMAAAIASCFCDQPVIITGTQAVNKTYPDFFMNFNMLGGKAVVI